MATLKLATPIRLARPAFFTWQSEAIESLSGTCAFGQWIINRSTQGSARRSRLSSTERSKSPEASRVNQTLVVRKISSRLTPEPRRPEPTSRSLPYICGSVEMAVAEFQCGLDQLDAQILLQRHCAEAEDRNARPVTFDHIHRWQCLHYCCSKIAAKRSGGPQHRRLPPAIPACCGAEYRTL